MLPGNVCDVKVFVSWSGPRSRQLADALREWIHDVIQSVECFCSTEDIRAGQRWNNEVNAWLSETDFGVLCVTPENVQAPWLNFEAGALAKRIKDDARVVPVTLGFAPAALEEPLKQFNGVTADKEGIRKLMKSIADIANPSMDIDRTFDRWWGDLSAKLVLIPDSEESVVTPEPPDVGEMFSDIMSSIRGLASDVRHVYPSNRGISSSEFRALATLLAKDDGLREDIASGNPSAMRYLREHSKDVARHMEMDSRRAREARARERQESLDSAEILEENAILRETELENGES